MGRNEGMTVEEEIDRRYRTIPAGEPGWAIYADINGKDVSFPGAEARLWISDDDGDWFCEMYVDIDEDDGLNYGLKVCQVPLREALADVICSDDDESMKMLRAILAEAITAIDAAIQTSGTKRESKNRG